MTEPLFERIALIGIGLIGSSISHATRRAGLARSIVGYAKTEATRQTALRLGLIDKAYATAQDAVRNADLVILCIPVGACGSIGLVQGITARDYPGARALASVPWLAVIVLLGAVALWILGQPMEMRGLGGLG